ncbi:MAG: pectate lyase [Chthoniobacteraceae bacterium]
MKHALVFLLATTIANAQTPSRDEALGAMRKAATFFRTKAAVNGGYVYYYSPDFSKRLGEGKASATQIWVQPPGTPAVGLAYLKAFAATGERLYLDAAREAAEALVYGQLASGGWMNSIDFGPPTKGTGKYRNGKGGRWDFSSLDDGITQTALRFLMHADRALEFKHAGIHAASESGRAALLAAQFEHGAFPQGWDGPVAAVKAVKASFPDYDWKTENRIKEYWDMPTLNDDLCGYVSRTLLDGWDIYKDDRCRAALVKLGDFLLLAQMPEPQPGWAQQYDAQMRPIWARKFEPPAVAGRESQDAIETLMLVHRLTRDAKYLEPIPRALAWLKRSLLPDGRLARYYELKSNKPLYMTDDYQLTHDDSKVPKHYGWKTESHIAEIENAFAAAKSGAPAPITQASKDMPSVSQIVRDLDAEGRWMSTAAGGEMLVGQPKFKPGEQFIASEVFNRNLEALSDFVKR